MSTKGSLKVYVAGPLCSENERKKVEKIDELCRKLGFKTYLPHRDCGIVEFRSDLVKAFKEDVKALDWCDVVVANLDFEGIGAGTCWELGYAYAKSKKLIGIRLNKEKEVEKLSAMLLGSMKIVRSFDELEKEMKRLI